MADSRLITRRLFLRAMPPSLVAATAIPTIMQAEQIVPISAHALDKIAVWRGLHSRANVIWERYCSLTRASEKPERELTYALWRVAYESSSDALTDMIRALHVEGGA